MGRNAADETVNINSTHSFTSVFGDIPTYLKYLSSAHALSPCYHRENDITDTFDLTFSVDHNRFGRNTKYDLKEDGCDIPVTNENKDEYIHLYVQWRFKLGIEKQFNTLQKGFHEIITPNLLKQFDERELELIVSGLGSVDVDDWMSNTRLKHCTPDTDVVRWFWKVREGGASGSWL